MISCLSTHPFKYASRVSAHLFWQTLGFIYYCLKMVCKVICQKCMGFFAHDVQCWFVNDSLKRFKRPPQFIIHMSKTSEQSNWSLMSRTMLCRASKTLKSVALSDSTNISIGRTSVAACSTDCLKLSTWHLHWLHTPAPTPACSTLQWFHILGLRSSGLP